MTAESRAERKIQAALSANPPPPGMFDAVKKQVLTALASDLNGVICEAAASGQGDYMMDTSNGMRQPFRWVHVTLMIRENMGMAQPMAPPPEPEPESDEPAPLHAV